MKELWSMQRDFSKDCVYLIPFKVVKETEKQIHVGEPGGRVHRVNRVMVDTLPTFHGSGGCWFSDKFTAIRSWEISLSQKIEKDTKILNSILELKAKELTPKKAAKKK